MGAFAFAQPAFATHDAETHGTCYIVQFSAADPTRLVCDDVGGTATGLDDSASYNSYLTSPIGFTPSAVDCGDVDDDICPDTDGLYLANYCNGYGGNRDVYLRFIELGSDIVPAGAPSTDGEIIDTISCADLCGNGVVDGTEQCDVGPGISTDGCVDPGEVDECMFEGAYSQTCGDGIVDAPEECDDGDTSGGDGCSALCAIEGGYLCQEAPSSCAVGEAYNQTCGDGLVDTPEECDDGNTSNSDGCSATCTTENGYTCVEAPSVCSEGAIYDQTCGDGIVDAPEECDDGDTVNGDGCDISCAVETGFVCPFAPSMCTEGAIYAIACGDGIVDAPEACDDGNVSSGDGCSASCVVESGYSCTGAPSSCDNLPPMTDDEGLLFGILLLAALAYPAVRLVGAFKSAVKD